MLGDYYPEIEPFETGFLSVADNHQLYYERCGNKDGFPIVFLHGGPGGGISADNRRFFDPEKYQIILFDQRGAGKSKPFASLEDNTTWDLVEDIEKLRRNFSIEKWAVFGGSWGSTLALTYAIKYPERCAKLFLRGIFLLRNEDIRWFYQEGASFIFPDFWKDYASIIPSEEQGDFVDAYYKRLTHEDEQIFRSAARAWAVWEARCSRLVMDKELINKWTQDSFAEAIARIECHYFFNKGFFEDSNYILNNIQNIRQIPSTIVHGRYDMVCPVKNAFDLYVAWPESELIIVPDAGHSALEQGIRTALIKALDDFNV